MYFGKYFKYLDIFVFLPQGFITFLHQCSYIPSKGGKLLGYSQWYEMMDIFGLLRSKWYIKNNMQLQETQKQNFVISYLLKLQKPWNHLWTLTKDHGLVLKDVTLTVVVYPFQIFRIGVTSIKYTHDMKSTKQNTYFDTVYSNSIGEGSSWRI